MLPQLPSKQLLHIRAISTMVFDKIVSETVDSNLVMATQIQMVSMPTAEHTLIMIICMYSAYMYYKTALDESRVNKYTKKYSRRRSNAKQAKREKLNKYVLTESGYNLIKMCLFILFLLIKDPKAVV
jgi:hypothetical protein